MTMTEHDLRRALDSFTTGLGLGVDTQRLRRRIQRRTQVRRAGLTVTGAAAVVAIPIAAALLAGVREAGTRPGPATSQGPTGNSSSTATFPTSTLSPDAVWGRELIEERRMGYALTANPASADEPELQAQFTLRNLDNRLLITVVHGPPQPTFIKIDTIVNGRITGSTELSTIAQRRRQGGPWDFPIAYSDGSRMTYVGWQELGIEPGETFRVTVRASYRSPQNRDYTEGQLRIGLYGSSEATP